MSKHSELSHRGAQRTWGVVHGMAANEGERNVASDTVKRNPALFENPENIRPQDFTGLGL